MIGEIRKIIISIRDKCIGSSPTPKISLCCYYYLQDKSQLNGRVNISDFSEDKKLFACGYFGLPVDQTEFKRLKKSKPRKGFHYTYDIYNCIGLYLSSPEEFKEELHQKFCCPDLKFKYLISKIEASYVPELPLEISNIEGNYLAPILTFILTGSEQDKLGWAFQKYINQDNIGDLIDLIILEDLQNALFTYGRTTFLNKTAYDITIEILGRFSNSIKKLILNRRKGKELFIIKDEYDVQDILSTVFQSIFPTIEIEGFNQQFGGRSSRVEFFIREHGIMVETKMIKEKDDNHKKFVKEIQEDMELYHRNPDLEELIFFIYDPEDKTLNDHDFYDLQGEQIKRDHKFNVTVIIQP